MPRGTCLPARCNGVGRHLRSGRGGGDDVYLNALSIIENLKTKVEINCMHDLANWIQKQLEF